eukprot:4355932-Prymnesium_polylepis.1
MASAVSGLVRIEAGRRGRSRCEWTSTVNKMVRPAEATHSRATPARHPDDRLRSTCVRHAGHVR